MKMSKAVFASALAAGLAVPSGSAGASGGGWVWPLQNMALSCVYFDPNYPASQSRQHLGLDMALSRGVTKGAVVVSPVEGSVVVNHTGMQYVTEQSYLVIRESATGVEHVLGHIRSNASGTVHRGAPVGVVGDWGTNSHVHWGANMTSVQGAMGVSGKKGWGAGDWGWGKAPVTAVRNEAANRGWIDMNAVAGNVGHYCSK